MVEHGSDPEVAVSEPQRPLEILLLADDAHAANSVVDHIEAFRSHSRHRWFVVNPMRHPVCATLSFERFDAIAIHYSIAVIWDSFLPKAIRRKIERFNGLKLQFIQDEYRKVRAFSERMAELGIELLFTLVRPDLVERAYDHPGLRCVRKVSVLPGYVPEKLHDVDVPPIRDRKLDIAYRSRRLPYWYGELGQEKVRIAEQTLARAAASGLVVDISVREEDRVYGEGWIRFLSSARSVLGTEGGASIWDFDGSVQREVDAWVKGHPDATFVEVSERILAAHEGNLPYNTMSPRLFEAAALRTPMVMFPGWYNGVVEPHRHYIPVEKDFSNWDEVVRRLRDDAFLQDLADRTHKELVESGRYSKQAFIALVDHVVDEEAIAHGMRPEATTRIRIRARSAYLTSATRAGLQVERVLALLWRVARRPFQIGRTALRILRDPDRSLRAVVIDRLRSIYLRNPHLPRLYRTIRSLGREGR